MNTKKPEPTIPDDLTYESASRELEEILARLKANEVTIDQLEQVVARAAVLSKFCSEKLRDTEARVQSIIDKLEL